MVDLLIKNITWDIIPLGNMYNVIYQPKERRNNEK